MKRGAEAPLEVCCGSFAGLELSAKREFELTRTAIVAGAAAATLPADGTDRFDVAAGVTRSDVVEGVECIHAELDDYVLADGEGFGEAQVGRVEPWATIGVLARVTEVVRSGVDEGSVAQ